MAYFPIFTDLTDKPVLIVGASRHAEQKAALLAPFRPRIRFLEQLSRSDLEPAPALVILAGDNRAEAARLCRERNIPVNSVDDPENCTFYFPSLICRGDCTVGISTAGTAPAASRVLRQEIEAVLPGGLEEILPWLGELTARLRQSVPDYDRRARILAAVSREAFRKNRPLTGEELAGYM